MHHLRPAEIERLADGRKVNRAAVENFLGSLDMDQGAIAARSLLRQSAKIFRWNEATVIAIATGITIAFNTQAGNPWS